MKLRTVFIIITLPLAFSSCKNYTITNEQINQYQDSLFAIVPTKGSIQARTEGQTDEAKQLRVVVGVGAFYDAPAEDKQAYAIKAGQMAIRLLGDAVGEGSLTLTKQINWNSTTLPPDAIIVDMKIDSLRQAMAPKK